MYVERKRISFGAKPICVWGSHRVVFRASLDIHTQAARPYIYLFCIQVNILRQVPLLIVYAVPFPNLRSAAFFVSNSWCNNFRNAFLAIFFPFRAISPRLWIFVTFLYGLLFVNYGFANHTCSSSITLSCSHRGGLLKSSLYTISTVLGCERKKKSKLIFSSYFFHWNPSRTNVSWQGKRVQLLLFSLFLDFKFGLIYDTKSDNLSTLVSVGWDLLWIEKQGWCFD